MIAYDFAADYVHLKIGIPHLRAIICLKWFCDIVTQRFESQHPRNSTKDDIARILSNYGRRGFPGMLHSIEGSKIKFRNCLAAYHGQYKGKEKAPAVMLERLPINSSESGTRSLGCPDT